MYKAAAWIVGGLLGAVLLALVFTLGYVSSDRLTDDSDSGPTTQVDFDDVLDGIIDFNTLEQIVEVLKDGYVDRTALDEQLLYEAAIAGMLDSLADTGTFYVDPTSYALSLGPSGSFEGIGATVNQQDENIVIVNPFEGSPAEAAGLVGGDLILAVDGESIVGWPLDRAVLKVRGPTHKAGASTFSDWWAYKFEVYDAIPYNGALMWERGVVVSFNSDSSELARRLNLEAAKAVKYGHVPEAEALKFVTLNPAIQLGIDHRVGSLELGKDADFVLWSGSPLATSSIALETWLDGRLYFSRKHDLAQRTALEEERRQLVARAQRAAQEPKKDKPGKHADAGGAL